MNSEMWILAAEGLGLVIVMMTILWAFHLRIRNAALVDVGWAAGLGVIAWFFAALGSAPLSRRLMMAALVGTWSFRLAWHLYRDRVANGTPEEGRYITLRAYWGAQANHYFLYFFWGQGLLDAILALPFLLIAFNPNLGTHPLEWAAAALWIVGIVGETLADAQLKSFKSDANNKGRVCRKGLWNFSRHPNYFFEWLMWCSYALMATTAPLGWLGWISPAIILFLLLKVTGIPPTEKQALKSRGAEYGRYQASVNAFFPWFPRKLSPDTRKSSFERKMP